jgi:hypothetical protein
MSDSTTTSTIDEKKDENTGSSNGIATNIGNFLKSVFSIIIIIVIYFFLGGLVLYGCKIGQANILPTDKNCYPYTNLKPELENIPINIFTTFFEPQMSMKINFPYNKFNSSNIILDMFRKYKEEPKSNFLANYFISIIESLLQFNYSSLNFILNIMNGLPEVVIVLIGPILIGIATSLLFLFDNFYLIYLWFANMGWFFKQNTNTDLNHKPVWEDVTFISWFDYACAIGLIILFIILFWVVLISLPVLPFITLCLTIFTSINYIGVINDKSANALTIIKDIFKYYKITFMSIFSFFVIISAFANLGTIPGVFSIITLGLIYWGIISIDLFKETSEEGLSKLASYDQAKKVCNFTEAKKDNHGLLYNLVFGNQSGGKNLAKELKKIGKNLSRK